MKNWINRSKGILASALVMLFLVNPIFAAPVIPQLPTAPKLPIKQIILPIKPVAPRSPSSSTNKTSDFAANKGALTTTPASEGTNAADVPVTGGVLVVPGVQTGAGTNQTTAGNQKTGSGSSSNSVLGSGSNSNITTSNDANVNNNVGGGASSGGNSSSYNTGNGNVKSGKANVVLSILNFLNTTLVALPGGSIGAVFSQVMGNLLGNYIVDQNTGEAYSLTGSRLSVGNSNTGADSKNTSVVNTGSNNTVTNNNNATVGNNIDVSANTGGNQASYNTGNGSVSSGDANVSLNLMNFVNSSIIAGNLGIFGVLNVFGNWLGNFVIPDQLSGGLANLGIVVGNNNTGAGSTNTAEVNANSSTNIDNNNNANIGTNVTANANTGGNTSDFNTGNGTVNTGSSNVKLDVAKTANQNVVGDSAMLIMINVLGTWNGVQYAGPIIIASKDLINSGLLSSLNIGNKNTGANSTNNATLNANNSTDISNNNNANIGNNINLSANTGNNQSSYNTGNGSVSTGDANIMANIMNFANYNIQASKVVMMVINVFGDWTGTVTNTNKTVKTASSVSQASSNASNSFVAGNFVGDILIRQNPVVKNLSVILKPNDSGKTQNVTLLSAKSGGNGAGISPTKALSEDNSLAGFLMKYGIYLFGILLAIYFAAIAVGIYRRKLAS